MEEISTRDTVSIVHRCLQQVEVKVDINCCLHSHNYLSSEHLHLNDVIVFEWGISPGIAADHD